MTDNEDTPEDLSPANPGEPQGAKESFNLVREAFFPTLIYYQDLPDAEALNAHIKHHVYKWREEDEAGIVRSNVARVGSWHSALDMAQRPEYRVLVDHILASAQIVYDDLGYDPGFKPVISNMWANINPKYGYNRNHVHPNVHWSGVYYVQAYPDSGQIFFSDPRYQAQMYSPRYAPDQTRKAEVWSEVYYKPIEGRIILFPSWLMHEVEPNMSDLEGDAGNRISISFNIDQRWRGNP